MIDIQAITVLYDSECAFCRRCRKWILSQHKRMPIEFMSIHSPDLDQKYPALSKNKLDQLVVITDRGDVYYKDKAFVICLYALSEYYEWSFKLSEPMFLPMVRKVYQIVSRYRNVFSPRRISRNDKVLYTVLKSHDDEAGNKEGCCPVV